tara:strand:+ start:1836 stop:2171 length:336 start_codon:yes stop_codon:yes gene_type:complete
MFKYVCLLVFILISFSFYELYEHSLLSEEQKQEVITRKAIEKEKAEVKKSTLIKKEKAEALRVEKLSNTPWKEVKEDQYADKFIASKTYLWFLLFLVPTLIFKLINSKNAE